MMKKYFGIFALVLCLGLASCEKEDAPVYSESAITNVELKAILEKSGVQFDEMGHMLMNEAVENLTSLDLSGTKMEDFSEIKNLPNVTELKLSNKGYGPVFDFAILPEQITGVDLTGNEISEYSNLIKVEIAENGDETITNLRDIKKLYLPEAAKNNTTDLIRFHRQNETAIESGDIDMQMADAEGKLSKFTTLRVIPDANLSAYLEKSFGTIFTDGKVDLSKRFTDGQNLNPLIINQTSNQQFNVEVANFEGIQYIINNPYWEGTMITLMLNEVKEMPAIKVSSFATDLFLEKMNCKTVDLSGAENMLNIRMIDVNGIESVDLRGSKVWGQHDKTQAEQAYSSLVLLGCKNIKSIYFPNAKELRTYELDFECLDALKTCDLSKFIFVKKMIIGDLPDSFELVYPNLTEVPSDQFIPGPDITLEGKITFGCSTKTYGIQATKDFIAKYKNFEGKMRISCESTLTYPGNEGGTKGQYWR